MPEKKGYKLGDKRGKGSKGLAKRKAARSEYKKVAKKAKPGSGKRFAALSKSIEAEGKSPKAAKAIAAAIGRKRYGAKKMASWSAKGRKK